MGRLIFVERNGARIAVEIFQSVDSGSLVVIIPAMGAPARSYRRFAHSLGELGHEVAVMDLRGIGESKPGPNRESNYDYLDLTEDVGAVLAVLRASYSASPLLLVGHSMGGLMAAAHVARTAGDGIEGMALIAAGIPYWRDYGSRAWSAHLLRMYVLTTVAIAGYWPGIGFGGPQSAGVMRDWAFTSRTGQLPAKLCVGESIAQVRVPTLVVTVDGDQYTPPRVVNRLVALLKSAPTHREHITTDQAASALDHFKWMKTPDTVAQAITRWASAR